VTFALAAAIRPQVGASLVQVEREGIEVIAVLDVSLSMEATDVIPNRLERSKQEVRELFDGLRGDKVGVVEIFQPGCSAPKFPPDMIRDALIAIDGATIPLSPSKRATARWAVPAIEQAIAPHRGGRSSETEAKAVLDHLIRSTLLKVEKVKISRLGGRSDERDGLVLTSAGKLAVQNQPPQSPQPPATSVRDDAGGAPSGPRNAQGGMGEMRGAAVAGTRGTNSSSTAATEPPAPQGEATEVAASTTASEAQTAAPESSNTASEMPSEPIAQSSSTEGCRSASKAATPSPPPTFDEDLTIPDFLDRRKADEKLARQGDRAEPPTRKESQR
jgi:hypothetical protein